MEHVSVWSSFSAVDHMSVAALELMAKGGEVIPLAVSRYDTLKKKLEPVGEFLVIKQIIELSPLAHGRKKDQSVVAAHLILAGVRDDGSLYQGLLLFANIGKKFRIGWGDPLAPGWETT